MSSETVVAAALTPYTATQHANLPKDAALFVHSLDPRFTLKKAYKNGNCDANSCTVNQQYIFAAQVNTAALHVYDRQTETIEHTFHHEHQITSLTTTACGENLIIGFENGSVSLFEIASGREIKTSQRHLRPVTVLRADFLNNIFLSGSKDTDVHVWILCQFTQLFESQSGIVEAIEPSATLSGHRGDITGIEMGRTFDTIGVVITSSQDGTAVIWNVHDQTKLRTLLLHATPLCMTLHPQDRMLYVGLSNGQIQAMDFISMYKDAAATASSKRAEHTAVQPEKSKLMGSMNPLTGDTMERDAVFCLTINKSGTTLLSGHESGSIVSWKTSTNECISTVARYTGAPIKNLVFVSTGEIPTSQIGLWDRMPTKGLTGYTGRHWSERTWDLEIADLKEWVGDKDEDEGGVCILKNSLLSLQLNSSLIRDGINEIRTAEKKSNQRGGEGVVEEGWEEYKEGHSTLAWDGPSDREKYLEEVVKNLSNNMVELSKENRALRERSEEVTELLAKEVAQRQARENREWSNGVNRNIYPDHENTN